MCPGLHPGIWIRGGANWAIKKCRKGEVIRIIAVQMNLPDPRGGRITPLAPAIISVIGGPKQFIATCVNFWECLNTNLSCLLHNLNAASHTELCSSQTTHYFKTNGSTASFFHSQFLFLQAHSDKSWLTPFD